MVCPQPILTLSNNHGKTPQFSYHQGRFFQELNPKASTTMLRACLAGLILAGAAIPILLANKEKPYPYPVAYKFGYDYHQESVKEEAWQSSVQNRLSVPGAPQQPTLKLTRFWPRFPDTEEGAMNCWQERRKITPILYVDPNSHTQREPTAEERQLEKEGWIAGYMASVHGKKQ